MTDTTDRASSRKAIEKVNGLLAPILEKSGLCLVNARFVNQGKRRVLEVTIHKSRDTVSLDDCEKVSRALDKQLDKLASSKEGPLMDGAFVLQVQSPGIDRRLKTQKELKVFVGENVEVQSKIPIDSLGAHFTGLLQEADDGMVTITDPVAVETQKKKKKGGKKKKKAEVLVLDPVTEITLEFNSLTFIKLAPTLKDDQELEEEEVLN